MRVAESYTQQNRMATGQSREGVTGQTPVGAKKLRGPGRPSKPRVKSYRRASTLQLPRSSVSRRTVAFRALKIKKLAHQITRRMARDSRYRPKASEIGTVAQHTLNRFSVIA